MAKIIKLKESDLENIVKRVLAEQEEEATEQVVDRLKAKVAGGVGAVKARQQNRKSFRDTKKSYVKTGKPKELPKGQNPKEEKVKAELKSLVRSMDNDVKNALKNIDRVVPNVDGMSNEMAQAIQNYKNNLNNILALNKILTS
jgi:hypothetical protein